MRKSLVLSIDRILGCISSRCYVARSSNIRRCTVFGVLLHRVGGLVVGGESYRVYNSLSIIIILLRYSGTS